jgi:Centromere DNA-binding protein complex CBF3 subunit, domain 2
MWQLCLHRYDNSLYKGQKKPYIQMYKRFINWVYLHRDNTNFNIVVEQNAEGQPLYITQPNVESYFEHEVPGYSGQRKYVKRIFNSLLWARQYLEDPLSTVVLEWSHSITKSVERQQSISNSAANLRNACVDPHKGLKDLLSPEEVLRICRTIHTERADCLDAAFTYLWGCNAAVRGSSCRVFTLCDLNMSTGFGPESEPPRNRTLLMILRSGRVHKDNHISNKQVGVQRHKDFRLCTVFATAALVISKLRTLDTNITFLNPYGRPAWWDIPMTRYKEYSQMSNAMNDVLQKSGVDFCKSTHFRTQAVQYAGSRGLNSDQMCAMTKHLVDKLHTAYAAEVDEECMKVMSGFRKNDVRFVREEHIEITPEYLAVCTKYLLPHYDRYLRERLSPTGDPSSCCTTFLTEVLPYFVEVAVQTGVYFTLEYRQHPFSRLLMVSTSTGLGFLLVLPIHTNL